MKIISRLILAIAFATSASVATADDEFGANPTWTAPPAASVRAQALDWAAGQSPDESVRRQVEDLWTIDDDEMPTPAELLERLVETFVLIDPAARELVERCSRPFDAEAPLEVDWLLDEQTPSLIRNNLRLVYGQWLAQARQFDATLLYLGGLDPDDVVDPAALLFYRAVAHHRLVDVDASRNAVARLLEREEELPRRYQQLAGLMKEDLKNVEIDSLNHISRRMDDVGRRLDLGQANRRVRDIEDGVIESLDKLIKELEDAAQQQRQRQQPQPGRSQSSKPMEKSQIGGQRGPGKVDKKDIGSKKDWGSMPPKEREEAMQEIIREFPSHYRDVIEQYFKRLATESTEQER